MKILSKFTFITIMTIIIRYKINFILQLESFVCVIIWIPNKIYIKFIQQDGMF